MRVLEQTREQSHTGPKTDKRLPKLIRGILESFARHKFGGVGGADSINRKRQQAGTEKESLPAS